jgi:hypothetical protein
MEWPTTMTDYPMKTSPTSPPNNVDVNCTPALERGARGTPPSTLRQLTDLVTRGTLARPGRFSRPGINPTASSLAERIRSMAWAQMTAQSRLMATVAVSNDLIRSYMNAGPASPTGSAMTAGC